MTVYYVDAATGNDADPGTSEGDAWLTIDKALSTIAAGDKVWIKGGTSYTETANCDIIGGQTNQIVLEGYTSTTGDGGTFIIDGASTRANGITTSNGPIYHTFKNMEVINHTGDGIGASILDRCKFENCIFKDNGGYGVFVDDDCLFLNCTFQGNTSGGLSAGWTAILIDCLIQDNSGKGIGIQSGTLFGCIFTGNAGKSIEALLGVGTRTTNIINCTIDGGNVAGTYGFWAKTSNNIVINSAFYDLNTAIEADTAVNSDSCMLEYLSIYSCNNDIVNMYTPDTLITSDPLFVDPSTEDYEQQSGSPLYEAGVNNSDIGALSKAIVPAIVIQRRNTFAQNMAEY